MQEIMTIEEVAAYIRVSERTVYDWAQKGEIPGGKLGTTWRFKREDVETWVNSRLSGKIPGKAAAANSDVLDISRVVILDHANKNELLTRLVDLLAESPRIRNRDELLKGIFAREELMSTGIGFGVGVPHVRISAVTDLVMAVAVCKEAIKDYASLDNKPVQIVCMLAARADQHTKYIRTLAAVSNRLKDADTRKQIIEANDPAFIYEKLTAEEKPHA